MYEPENIKGRSASHIWLSPWWRFSVPSWLVSIARSGHGCGCSLNKIMLRHSHCNKLFHTVTISVLPALAGKTHTCRDHFVHFCSCCLLWRQVNIWIYLPHALMDFNQSWVKGATWEPSFADAVKGHISRSKVIWGQVVSRLKMWKCLIWQVEVQLEPNLVYWEPSYVHAVKGHIPR